MEPSKKVIVLTGGSRGIGLQTVRLLASQGHQVFATSRSATLEKEAGFQMVRLDVTDQSSVDSCVQLVISEAGRIDILINNAGFDLYGSLEDSAWDEITSQMDVNFYGTLRMIKAVVPHMRTQGGGRIINIGSLGGLLGLPLNSIYAASKFALEGVSDSLRLELLPHNIFVSILEPGSVSTDSLHQSIVETSQISQPYLARHKAMVSKMRSDGAKSPLRPTDVAATIASIIATPTPRLRYPVGSQAKWVPRMRSVMPQGVFEKMMLRLFPQ
jgi:short-subunit dehydrogenase